MAKHYPDTNNNPDFPKLEEQVLQTWANDGAFRTSVDGRSTNNEWVFYDGPPFANGLPHYGHLLTSAVKDIFARYHTMKGQKVERRFGWDCHGLPAEMGAEKELGVSGRKAIEDFGIAKFNEHCRTSVMQYTNEWQRYITRLARWVDFESDYKTMDTDYMESVLWAFKSLYDKGLVYESHRVMPYSWAAETPLSNFETRMDDAYRDRTDKAVYVAFELKEIPKIISDYRFPLPGTNNVNNKPVKIVAWTTTPWTLPSNLALAVSSILDYTFIERDDDIVIFSASSLLHALSSELLNGSSQDITFKGSSLLGLPYEPLFPYFAEKKQEWNNAFTILDGSDFIEEGSGTGVVHLAPGFGEDDQRVCAASGIGIVCPVDESGKYTNEIYDLEGGEQVAESNKEAALRAPRSALSLKGLNVIADTRKDESEPYNEKQLEKFGLANLRIVKWLKETGRLIKEEEYKHSYPHCWRTDTPLIYKAVPSWYVEVTKFRDRMVELNQQINWIPEHIKDGQFGKWLEGARDWSISRNRFWGTPIPVWRTESGKVKVLGSIAELEDFFGVNVPDLHKPFIDSLTKEENGETWRRVPDVFDCWFESGSMPFAQVHYPFENKDWFETHFPADFIVEYVGQTRGWFYTLMVLGTALFDKPPFKNCICHGVILDANGKKLSKKLRNYPDPFDMFDQYGADAMRWRMIKEPVMHGGNLLIRKDGNDIRDVVRLSIKPIWNAYHFFCLYANADGISAKCLMMRDEKEKHGALNTEHLSVMDKYILAKLKVAVQTIDNALADFRTPEACTAVDDFFEVLNNWYIRRSRDRFWRSAQDSGFGGPDLGEGSMPDPVLSATGGSQPSAKDSNPERGQSVDADKQAAYDTLYTVLVTMAKAAAPLLPLTMEEIYSGLAGDVRT